MLSWPPTCAAYSASRLPHPTTLKLVALRLLPATARRGAQSSAGGFRAPPAEDGAAGAQNCGGFFNTLAVPIDLPSSSWDSIIVLRHDTLGASVRLPGAGSKLPRPWLLPSALPAPGTRALAGRPVPPRATRHAAGYARRSRYARHIGSGLRPPFLSAGALFCGPFVLWFPLSRRLARFAHNPKAPNARPIPSFCGGACRPNPPLYYYRRAVGGAAPVNPCPRNARGGAVFFMVSCRLAAIGSWARRSCPHSSIKLP